MRELTIGKNDAGQRLDRFLSKALPLLPPALAQKYIRIKRVKVNGGRAQRDQRLCAGDVLQLYINDEFFDKPSEENLFLTLFKPHLTVVYEDEHLLLADKPQGMVVHADETEKVNTLINHIQAYLYQKREWNPKWENAFTPALCNRIDRNTGGIVIAAKNAEALRILNQKIKDREIDKRYLCIVHGTPRPASGRLEGQLFKDAKENRVYVTKTPQKGSKTCITLYQTLQSRGLLASCFMVVNDGSYAAGCVVSASEPAGAQVDVGTVITVYIAADPSVEITTPPEEPAATEPTTTPADPETPADGGDPAADPEQGTK